MKYPHIPGQAYQLASLLVKLKIRLLLQPSIQLIGRRIPLQREVVKPVIIYLDPILHSFRGEQQIFYLLRLNVFIQRFASNVICKADWKKRENRLLLFSWYRPPVPLLGCFGSFDILNCPANVTLQN